MTNRHFKFTLLLITMLLSGACSSTQINPDFDIKCSDPRPQICTMDYTPVCGIHSDGSSKTYSNGCSACSNKEVIGYNKGACPQDEGK